MKLQASVFLVIVASIVACSATDPTMGQDFGPPGADLQAQDGGVTDSSVGEDMSDPPDMTVVLGPQMNLNFDDLVYTVVHAQGAWYLGGIFRHAELISANRLIALDATGSPAAGACRVEAGFDGNVNRIAEIGNALYIVGSFTHYRGQLANRIAKIDATTCALDTTFSPPNDNGFDQDARVVATDGTSIYVGGLFTAYRGVANSAFRFAKLDATSGDLDLTVCPTGVGSNGFDGPVLAIAHSGASVYVGGAFSSYRGVVNSARALAKLNTTSGAIDATFSPVGATSNGFDSQIRALLATGGALYVGGGFTQYKNVANSARRIAKLDLATGAIDTTFSPAGATSNGFEDDVFALASSGTALYAAGAFTSYKGIANSANQIAKLDLTSGAIDTTFSPVGVAANGFSLQQNVTGLGVSGNALYVGGSGITDYRNVADACSGIAKLDATTGVLDTTFKPAGHDRAGFKNATGASSFLFSGTKIWVGGGFSLYGGKNAGRIARFPDATGELDLNFTPGADGFNNSVQALSAIGNSLYVGGEFTTYRGVADSAHRIAKLDAATGAIDTTFSPVGATANGFDNAVYSFAVAGGSLYVGGGFTAYRGVADSARRIAKLDPMTGAIDTTFSPAGASANGFNSSVDELVLGGGSLYVVGNFTSYRGVASSANHLAKLDATSGVIDTTFSPVGATANGFDSGAYAVALAGNALYVGGDFTTYRSGTANLYHGIIKLNATTGVSDDAFGAPGATHGFNAPVYSLAASGSSVYAGGDFTDYRGVAASASYLAKLDGTTGALDAAFTPTGATNTGFSSIYSITSYGPSLMLGGYFSECGGGSCATNARRVNAKTRLPE